MSSKYTTLSKPIAHKCYLIAKMKEGNRDSPTLKAVGAVSFGDSARSTSALCARALLQLKAFPRGRNARAKGSAGVCRLKSVDVQLIRGSPFPSRPRSSCPLSLFLSLTRARALFLFFVIAGLSRLKRREPNGGVNARTRHGVSTNFRVQLMHLSDGQKGSPGESSWGGKIIETSLSSSSSDDRRKRHGCERARGDRAKRIKLSLKRNEF